MKPFLALILVILLAVGVSRGEPAAAGPPWLTEEGDLQTFVAVHKVTLPGRDSFRYVEPVAGEVDAISAAVLLVRAGEWSAGAAALDRFGYDLVLFHDTRGGGDYLMLRERLPCAHCWGLFILNRDPAARDVAVEVPHPLFDTNTPEFGIEAFVRVRASSFLMAGAHRYSNGMDPPLADMARSTTSVFQRLHQELTGRDTHVLQYHGFTRDTRPPDYPNVVLSDGGVSPPPELFSLAAAYTAAGEIVGIYDGERYADLGATQNPQGRYSRGIGGRFYHLEHDNTIRAGTARRSGLVLAVLRWLEALECCPAAGDARRPDAAENRYPRSMEKLRAALLGCLLTGGAIFGARPLLPEDHAVPRTAYAAGPAGGGRTPRDFARWVAPFAPGASLAALARGLAPEPHSRRRCSGDRLRLRRC